jgi:hypothetical protein
MSSDPLARSDIWTGAPNDTEYDAVYAAVTATERGRWFLTEYANRNRHADTGSLVAAMARIESGMTANKILPLDLAAAAERILDIAIGLRERGVDPALCDALDAAAREICAVPARGEPAAAEASAPDLIEAPAAANENAGSIEAALDDGLSRGGFFNMEAEASKKFTEAVAALAASLTSPSAETVAPLGEETASATGSQSPSADAGIPPLDYAQASAPQPQEGLQERPQEPYQEPAQSKRRWHIEAPDFVFDRPSRDANNSHGAANDQPSQAHPLLAETPQPLGPDQDPDDIFEPLPSGVVIPPDSAPASPAAAPDLVAAPEAACSLAAEITPIADVATTNMATADMATADMATPLQLRIANGAPARANLRPAPSDPLADMRGLSEEELIALFG